MRLRRYFVFAMSAVFLLTFFAVPVYGTQEKHIGIDVSHHNGYIDWEMAAASGTEFAFIRAAYRTYGSGIIYTDKRFEENLNGAQSAGVPVGVYIYSQAINESEAVEEAEYVLDLLGGIKLELPIVIDFEFADVGEGYTGRLYRAGLSKQKMTDICRAFCETVRKAGYRPMVYAEYGMLRTGLDGRALNNEYGVWVARWTGETSVFEDCICRQYTDSGRVPGISGVVDMNVWYGALPDGYSGEVFYDLDGHFAETAVSELYRLGVFNGTGGGLFRPDEPMTRAMAAVMLWRLAGRPMQTVGTVFSDVGESAWYRDAVVWAHANELVKGYGNGKFGADDIITREQLAVLVCRFAGADKASDWPVSGGTYPDSMVISEWARDYVIWAAEKGILLTDGNGSLSPVAPATRGDGAVMLHGIL